MNLFVLIGHQKTGSFCHAIAATAIEVLRSAGHQVVYHDLYQEGFDPVLPHEEIPKDAELDPVVRQHLDEVVAADGYIIVHPNWWGQPPAILKGWIDRVLRQGHCYEFGPEGVVGLLQGRRALVLTTSNTPRDAELALFGDPLENLWKACVFNFCGIDDFLRRNFESIILSTPEQREDWLAEVRQLVGGRFPAAG
ncbi:MAG: NAD(P)H-dependent oxidoreductase [Candidatus Nealsonbacteria bacterium]|nr:NAD(P)H-dependent oxidoreductase [Candidatus Nealsonbacteria bacterium]